MQTLALMLAAVGLSLAIGIPLGILAGLSDRFERGVTPVLDAMQIIPAFAYLMPIVILFSVGPGAAVITTMIYAIPPAIRITALGIRGVPANTVEAAPRHGVDEVADAREGAPAARAADVAPVGQPDDPLRALDGRHRRPDRRQGPRRRRDERPELLSRPRPARRSRDRGDGNGARPGHGGRRGADEPRPSPPHGRPPPAAASRDRSDGDRGRRGRRGRAHRGRRRRLLPHDRPRLAARTAPVRTGLRPEPRHVPVPDHELGRRPHRPVRARALPGLPRGDALAGDAGRGHVDLARGQRAAARRSRRS